MIRLALPAHLRTLASVAGEVKLELDGELTQGALLDALARLVGEKLETPRESPPLTRARHRHALGEAVDALERAGSAKEAELMAEDLRLALRALGRITGRVDVEDLLDAIFRDFCIGK